MNGYFFLKGVKDWDALKKLQSEGTIRAFARLVTGDYTALVAVKADSAESLAEIRDVVCPVGTTGCVPVVGPIVNVPNHPLAIFPVDIVLFGQFSLVASQVGPFVEHALSHEGVAASAVHGGDVHALVEITAHDLAAASAVLASVAEHPGVTGLQTSVSGAALMTGAGVTG